MDNRAVSTVVEKTLAIGLVALFVSLTTLTLYGGVVPDYRAAVGQELAERTLATATERVQQSVPPAAHDVDARTRVDLPATIHGSAYRIRADGDALVLDHPHERISARSRLALPASVARVEGEWHSGGRTVVRVESEGEDLVVRLETEGR